MFFDIWPFLPMKICPIVIIFAKVDSKFCQLIKCPQSLPDALKLYQKANFRPIWSHWCDFAKFELSIHGPLFFVFAQQ